MLVTGIVILVILAGLVYTILLHNGRIKDADKDFIPDTVEDKVKETAEEIKARHEAFAKNLGEAIDALKGDEDEGDDV